jgi:hypothetical protein
MISGTHFQPSSMSDPKELRSQGLKVTVPRLKVLDLFKHSPDRHLTAEDVYRKLLDEHSDVGLATVYRVLTQFEQAGLLQRTHFEGGKAVLRAERRHAPRPPRLPAVRPRRGVLRCGDREAPDEGREGARFHDPRAPAPHLRGLHQGQVPVPPEGLRRAMKPTLKAGLTGTYRYKVPPSKTVPNVYPEAPDFQLMPRGARHRLPGRAVRMGRDRAAEAPPRLAARAKRRHAREPLAHRRHAAGLTVEIVVTVSEVQGRMVGFSIRASDGIDRSPKARTSASSSTRNASTRKSPRRWPRRRARGERARAARSPAGDRAGVGGRRGRAEGERACGAPKAAAASVGEPIRVAELPKEARDTIALVRKGGPYPYAKDHAVFGNREGSSRSRSTATTTSTL